MSIISLITGEFLPKILKVLFMKSVFAGTKTNSRKRYWNLKSHIIWACALFYKAMQQKLISRTVITLT